MDSTSRQWILWALGAATCFATCNETISEITNKVELECLFYFVSGNLLTGVLFNVYDSCKHRKVWNHQNIIVDGKLKWKHLLGMVAFGLNYVLF